MAQPPEPARKRRQVNVRLPDDLIDDIDARRAGIRQLDGTLGISRDRWIENASRFALAAGAGRPTAPGRRTARG